MKSSHQDKAEGAGKVIKGKLKQGAGKVSKKEELEAEGKVDELEGKAQKKRGDVKKVFDK